MSPMLNPGDAQLIAEEFDVGDCGVLDGPVARGEVGAVWRLTTSVGVFAVKVPFEAPVWFETEDEAAFQELGVAAGVPAPRVVRSVTGRVLGDVRGVAVRVYEWVDLGPPDRSLDPVVVAHAVAQLHRLGYVGTNGLNSWYTDPIGEAKWRSVAHDLDRAGAPFADRFAERLDELVGLERLIVPPARVLTCHRDLFADNVLARADGVCVIDWENSGHADPSYELAVVLFEFAGDDPQRVRDLYAAYCDAGGPGVVDGPEAFSMAIAQIGHIGHFSARRWLDTSGAARERNAARVVEFVDDGLTRRHIDLILDAVAR